MILTPVVAKSEITRLYILIHLTLSMLFWIYLALNIGPKKMKSFTISKQLELDICNYHRNMLGEYYSK